ncbi:uncharacterized protein DS421_19g656600 [Arachis hypogaea]|uniref:Uncharacterized protein n=1 Tax=Arachis hypogaea TaxID=3818 RepID=A0A6B9V8V2_ARAHY|nr:uncharacterized protein DS421_19g656600 [Arachis hypogaea]
MRSIRDGTKQRRKHDRGRRRRGCRQTRIHCRTASQLLLRSRAAGAVNVIIMTLLYVGDLDPEINESGFDLIRNEQKQTTRGRMTFCGTGMNVFCGIEA